MRCTYLVCDIRSNLSPIAVHLFQESEVVIAVEKLVVALLRLDCFKAGVLQHDDYSSLRILFLRLLESILL